MTNAPFADLVTCLRGDQPPRVWSLLVTVFGELAQDEGAMISGALLRRMSEMIGLRPEALRVALHRLRKDGWIISHRRGRSSDYALTDWGRAQCAAASPRIYATGPLAQRAFVIVQEPGQTAPHASTDMVPIGGNIFLSAQPTQDPKSFTTRLDADTPLPDWMLRKICDPEAALLAKALIAALDRLKALVPAPRTLDPLESAVLRVLIVHDWRRFVLRLPVLPDHVFPTDWPGSACRSAVAHMLQHIPKQSLHQLDAALSATPPA